MELNDITRKIIGAAITVHRTLGPGLLESAYEACLAFELRNLGLKVEQQKPVGLVYHDVKLECGYRLDLLVEDQVIVEIKAIENVLRVHKSQLLSHLRFMDCRLGLLINFHVDVLRNGLTRIANKLYPSSAFSAPSATSELIF
jgi:GxxExxY protein